MTPGSYVHDKHLCEGYYVDAQHQRTRAEAAEARLEAAERERDHWIVETKKADRRLEAAERERDTALETMKQWNLYAKEYAARAEVAEAENERLRSCIEGISKQVRREGYSGLADRLAALAARTEEPA